MKFLTIEEGHKRARELQQNREQVTNEFEQLRSTLALQPGKADIDVEDSDRLLLHTLAKKLDVLESRLLESEALVVALLGEVLKRLQ